MRYAVIKSGGKQYFAEPGCELRVERLAGEVGSEIAFEEVLLACDEGGTRIGTPFVRGVKVQAQILRHTKATKVDVFKKKRRKNYRRRYGHRQPITVVRVTAIGSPTEERSNGTQERPGVES